MVVILESPLLTLQKRLKALKWATSHEIQHSNTQFTVRPQSRLGTGMVAGRAMMAWVGGGEFEGKVLCAPYRYATARSGVQSTLLVADTKIDCLQFNHCDGNLLTIAGRDGLSLWSLTRDGGAMQYPDVISAPLMRLVVKNRSPVKCLAWSPKVNELLSMVTSKDLKIIDCQHKKILSTCHLNGVVTHIDWNSRGSLLLASEVFDSQQFKIKVFDPRNSRLSSAIRLSDKLTGPVSNIISNWLSDDLMVTLTQNDNDVRLRLWDIRQPSGGELKELKFPELADNGMVLMHHEKEVHQFQLTGLRAHVAVTVDQKKMELVRSPVHGLMDTKKIIARAWAPRRLVKPTKGETSRAFLVDEDNVLTSFSLSVPKTGNGDALDRLQDMIRKEEVPGRKMKEVSAWWPEAVEDDSKFTAQALSVNPERSSSLLVCGSLEQSSSLLERPQSVAHQQVDGHPRSLGGPPPRHLHHHGQRHLGDSRQRTADRPPCHEQQQ
eukprot:GHVH01008242.1.p1 GENE.GHVH01008242.1~~GHVH01008242.1.p1  ORF type:complete len:492 (+),score=72.98 GHVH01008242.1:305-1780(+)